MQPGCSLPHLRACPSARSLAPCSFASISATGGASARAATASATSVSASRLPASWAQPAADQRCCRPAQLACSLPASNSGPPIYPGWHGIDCAHAAAGVDAAAPTRFAAERPWIAEHIHTPAAQEFAAGATRKRPLIYVYELPSDYSGLILQASTAAPAAALPACPVFWACVWGSTRAGWTGGWVACAAPRETRAALGNSATHNHHTSV